MTGNTRVKHKYLTFITKRTKNHLNHFPNTFDDKKLFSTFEPLGYATGENFAAFLFNALPKPSLNQRRPLSAGVCIFIYFKRNTVVNNTY